ncbi:hypothetical protein YSY43_44110 [Paenibacillus sp. YSY-4.3]
MNNEADLKSVLKSDIYKKIQSADFLNAEQLIKQYKRLHQEDPDIFIFQSLIHYEQNNLEHAINVLQKGIEIFSLHEELRYNLGFLFEKAGEPEKSSYHYLIASLITEDPLLKDELIFKIKGACSQLNLSESDIIKKYRNDLPKISVIIPTYNQEAYLKQAIHSLLDQSYPNLEIVVADDCSTDGTLSMMQQFEKEYRVLYKRNDKNLGPGINSCHAFYEYADGEYVLFLDHDDYLTDSGYILKAICLLERNKSLSFVFANCTKLITKTGETYQTQLSLNEEVNGKYYFMFYETKEYPHITSLLTSVFRRELAVQMKCLTEETQIKDLFLYLRLMLVGNVGFIPDNVGVYRIHDESFSYNLTSELDYLSIKEMVKLRDLAAKDYFSSDELLDKWLGFRLYAYFKWRFEVLRAQQNTGDIFNIMNYLRQNYHDAYLLLEKDLGEV